MDEAEMPPVPEAITELWNGDRATREALEELTQAYARQAVLAERERCAKLCEELIAWDMDDPGRTAAAHIRLGAQPGEFIDDYEVRAAAQKTARN